MVVVRSCCCGCTLRQGTIGTGIVSTLESILYLGLGAYFLNLKVQDGSETGDTVQNVLNIYGIICLVFGCVILAVTIFLFCAVQTQRRVLLLPWLIVRGIILGLSAIGAIISLFSGMILVAGGNIAWFALLVYLFLVVLAYYQTDMERNVSPGVILAPGNAGFASVPQQPGQHYVTSVPPAGGNVYVYPSQNPNPAGQPQYPTQSYGYAQQPTDYQQPQSGMVHPPAYHSNVYSDEPQKSAA